MHKTSHNAELSTFEVGESRYYETTLENAYKDCSTRNTPVSRRPDEIKDWKFTTNVYTAISSNGLKQPPVYLIKLTRTA